MYKIENNNLNTNLNNKFIRLVWNMVKHYNHDRYWKMRKEVIDPTSKKPKLLRYYYLFRIKRMDAFNNCSMSTDIGKGAMFDEPPTFPHGPIGVIVHIDAQIGKNCKIYHQVTIAGGRGVGKIGDNCILGAGCKIITSGDIGNNVKIGANSVVTEAVPDNCTVIGVPARLVKLNGERVDMTLKEYWNNLGQD
ncbi:MAG: serine acetyltransferase [Bacillota bacterium]|nr:serine acetyltransferase [Bacillota bacterium]